MALAPEHRVERAADAIFIVGLLLMTGICGIIAYALLRRFAK